MSADPQLRRTDLFLVRVWTRGRDASTGKPTWSGHVQRVVDGELYHFDSPQALTLLLGDMLVIDRHHAPGTNGIAGQTEEGFSDEETRAR